MSPRSCDALGVCQRRATPCAGCSHEAQTGAAQARQANPYFFAPGAIEEAPKPERWSVVEKAIAAVGLAAAGGVVVGLLRVLIERAVL